MSVSPSFKNWVNAAGIDVLLGHIGYTYIQSYLAVSAGHRDIKIFYRTPCRDFRFTPKDTLTVKLPE